MTDTTFDVFCPGMLEVLSIGKGDLKLTLDNGNPEDVEKARQLITEMLRKGYAIYVDTDKGPTRVKRFNPKRMTYIITEVVEPPPEAAAAPAPRQRVRVPVAGTRATAVGRTAGG